MQNEMSLEVFNLMQPELLPKKDLIEIIQKRCVGVQNLDVMSTETLIRLFRRVVSPLPQRFYRTNRRGKMLTARRAKTGLEGNRVREKQDPGIPQKKCFEKVIFSDDCQRHSSNKFIILEDSFTNDGSEKRQRVLGKGMKGEGQKKEESPGLKPSNRRVILKRPSSDTEKLLPSSESFSEKKMRRTTIKWP